MLRPQLELLVNDDSLQVPFGIVELKADEGQLANLNVQRQPPAPAVPEDIRTLAENAQRIILPNEWFRLVFYYFSLIAHDPITNTEALLTPDAWLSTLDAARVASPNRPIANTLVFDGLPAAENCFPRIVSQAAFYAIHRMMTWTDLQWLVLPYGRLNSAQSLAKAQTLGGQESTSAKILVVFYSDTGRSRDQIEKIKEQLSFVPEFFDELRPSNQEMVAGVSYLQVDNSSGKPICRTRSLSPDRTEVIHQEIAHVKTSMPWDAMAYGDNLADSILKAFDLQALLPPPGDGRKWPADCPEHPCNWLLRRLEDPMPPFPGEPGQYPDGEEKLEQDRWIFWTWHSKRWPREKIYKEAAQRWQLARPKQDAREIPDRTKTARKRAEKYMRWIGWDL